MRILVSFIGILLFWNISLLHAQTKGYVLKEGAETPLVGVNIYLSKGSAGIGITDKDGSYSLESLKKLTSQDTIVFSHVGYEQARFTSKDLKKENYRILLREVVQNLGEVVVTEEVRPFFLECEELAPLPRPLYAFGSFLSDGKIYVVAGDESSVRLKGEGIAMSVERAEFYSPKMYIYDIVTNTWTTERHKLAKRAYHAAHLYNNRIFVLGGKRLSTNRKLEYTDAVMEILDRKKDTVYVDPVNPHQAVNFTSFIYKDLLYVMGGSVKKKVYSAKIHALNLKTGRWYEMGTIPRDKRKEMNGIRVEDKVYILGGHRSVPSWGIECYDLLTERWDYLGELKEGVSYPGLAINGHLIYIYENGMLQVYNTRTKGVAAYPLSVNLENAGLYYEDEKLYIVGGCKRNGEFVEPANRVYRVDVQRVNIEQL